jgi:uncharacterized spore protein YtfJ
MDVRELMNRVSQNFSVSRAFGTAYEKDGTLVIPVALVTGGGGGGENSLATSTPESSDVDKLNESLEGGRSKGQSDTGSGAGFGGAVMPLGVYVVKDDQVSWVPVVNVACVIAGLCVLRLLGIMGKRRRRHHRS